VTAKKQEFFFSVEKKQKTFFWGACRKGVIVASTIISLSACGSPDPAIYTLQAQPGTIQQAAPQIIEVRRPGLAGYLDRSDVVLKDSSFQLHVNSQERWAEPLGDMIGRVLTQDLSQRLPASNVFSESGAISADPTLRVEVDVNRFDTAGDGVVTLTAGVAIEAGITHKPLRARTLTLTATPNQSGAAGLAATMSALLGQLADRVAQDVAGLPSKEASASF
jgi:uncharacterized lipoprotein YmbA